MSERVICDLCGEAIAPHEHYVVRIDVFADPAMPALDSESLNKWDADTTFAQLIEQMKGMSESELQDQVHRRFEHRICRACQRGFLVNPLGKPRSERVGKN